VIPELLERHHEVDGAGADPAEPFGHREAGDTQLSQRAPILSPGCDSPAAQDRATL
jgi:hypothetical protein